ncbi:MAG: energy transducer TonB [Desulfobacteraceae bacterium]|nr:MAG: energy transducer TonB [Desulfobacteraceae bacterium]
MASVSKKNKPNYLMRTMITVSLGIHFLVFLHIAGIYRSQAMTYIELTLNGISKPAARSIPRPRVRNEKPEITSADQREMKKSHMPLIPVKQTGLNAAEPLTADIGAPAVPFSGMDFDGPPAYITTGDYFDMVRMKIESSKRYPANAKENGREGQVNVRFVITMDGQISSLEIVKNSNHADLDQAAIEAVGNAAPFPRPPAGLFKDKIRVEIAILFELR